MYMVHVCDKYKDVHAFIRIASLTATFLCITCLRYHWYSENKQLNYCHLLTSFIVIQDEISSANGKVMVITFGLREGALRWLDEMKCTFPFLIDQHRKVILHFFISLKVYESHHEKACCLHM